MISYAVHVSLGWMCAIPDPAEPLTSTGGGPAVEDLDHDLSVDDLSVVCVYATAQKRPGIAAAVSPPVSA